MEKKPMRSYIKLIIPLLMLLIVFIVLFILRKGILFELKYDIEYDDELSGYVLTDIAIHDDPMLVLPSHTPDGKQIVGASGLFTEEHIFFNYETVSEIVIPNEYLTLSSSCTKKPVLFEELTSLERVKIGSGLENGIYGGMFAANISLVVIEVEPDNAKYYSEGNCIIERPTATLVVGCRSSVVPNGVKTIGQAAFVKTDIEELVIPSGVEKICASAFYDCAKLEKLNIPESVATIESKAIYSCPRITIYCDLLEPQNGWAEDFCEVETRIIWLDTIN